MLSKIFPQFELCAAGQTEGLQVGIYMRRASLLAAARIYTDRSRPSEARKTAELSASARYTSVRMFFRLLKAGGVEGQSPRRRRSGEIPYFSYFSSFSYFTAAKFPTPFKQMRQKRTAPLPYGSGAILKTCQFFFSFTALIIAGTTSMTSPTIL